MAEPWSEQIAFFNSVAKEVEILLSIARDSELQRNALTTLEALSEKLGQWKLTAIAQCDENGANLFLGCQSVARFLDAELNMWLLLKEQRPEDAWNFLIDAQGAITDAIRAHTGFSHLEAHAERLVVLERLVFPPQIFLSSALRVGRQECSICGFEYEDCSHLVGMPYWGEFCRRILKDVSPDHVAIVDEPANKRCRVTHFSVEGGRRNRMTWQMERDDSEKREPGRLKATGIILSENDLAS